VDSFPLPGRSAGIRVQGSKAVVRLVRYFLNGPSISFINDGKTLVGKPDLNGSPAVILWMAARSGKLLAGYSADGVHVEQLPVILKVDDLGGNLRGGVRFSTTTTDGDESSSTARFYYYRENVEKLVPYR
jgi:hypothetical protein